MSTLIHNQHGGYILPKFFTVILSPREEVFKMIIPDKFFKKYGHELSDVVNLKDRSGQKSSVQVVRGHGKGWFADGWNEFLDFHSITVGYFIVFVYTGPSDFNVIVYDTSVCEVMYQMDDTAIVAAENLSNAPGNSTSVPVLSTTPVGLEPTTLVKEWIQELGQLNRNQIIDLNLELINTYSFFSIMQPSSVQYGYRMHVPKRFAEEYMMGPQRVYIIEDVYGTSWNIHLEGSTTRFMKFNEGWKEFATDNNLHVGDICVFELVNTIKHVFRVNIIRNSAQGPGVVSVEVQEPCSSDEDDIIIINN